MTNNMQEKGALAGFGYEVGRLRFILRDFYQDGITSAANVAEHTYRVAMLAWTIAESEDADVGEVLKMALAHDLPEVRTLDFGVIASQYSSAKEHQAATDIMGKVLPAGLVAFEAYEARQTPEAKIVKDADRLDVVLECKELKCRGLDYPEQWDEELLTYREKLNTESARRMFDDIWAAHPMDWTLPLHSNRLNAIRQNTAYKLKVA